ncbi:MAG: NMD3-related protein [Candidatus Thorarchaeota archaeon]
MTCIECGSTDDSYNYLCKECYLKSHPIIESRYRLKLNICKICGAPSVKPDLWYESPSKEQFEFSIINALIELIDYRYKIRTLSERSIEILEIDERIFELNEMNDIVEGKFRLRGIPDLFLPEISIEEDFSVFLKYRKCKGCQLIQNGGATVAKVQLRCNRRQMDEIRKELDTFFSNFSNGKNQNLLPSSEEELKDGWDISYFDTHGAEVLAQFLKENFSAHLIKTKEIITYNRTKNKNVTRTVISTRLPEYLIGDIILFEDKPYQIVQITTKSTKLHDFSVKTDITKTNEIMLTLNITSLYTRSELTKFQVLSIDNAVNSVQLMNLSTYDYIELNLSDLNYEIYEGMEILGFYWNDIFYVDQLPPVQKFEQKTL